MKLLALSTTLSLSIMGMENSLLNGQKLLPTREHAIILTPEGVFPQQISLFAGEQLKLFLTSTPGTQGGITIASHDIFLTAEEGSVASAKIIFMTPGTYAYHCPRNSMATGTITVLPHPQHRRKKQITRSPAAKPKATHWIPREF